MFILIWEWQNRFSTEATIHMRVPKAATGREMPQSTCGTWPLPRRCWVHPKRMSKAPHPHCSEYTVPCSAIAREVFEREALAELHLPHHSSWRSKQGVLPLHTYGGQTANSGKSLLVPVGFYWLAPRCLFPHQTPLSPIWHASLGNFKLQNKLQ